jgi:heat shock protein HslJ
VSVHERMAADMVSGLGCNVFFGSVQISRDSL